MKYFFINLEDQNERRDSFLQFEKDKNLNDSLFKRFSAITISDKRIKKMKGSLNATGKAVYLSHRDIINDNINNSDDIWICEDDTYIFPETIRLIKNFNFNNYNWDIIFTDIGIGNINQMLYLYQLKKKIGRNDFILLDLFNFKYFGLSSYIINKNSKKKILNFFDKYVSSGIDKNLDLIVRDLSKKNSIKALCFFPFITSINKYADIDGVNTNATSKTFNIFRKLMCFKKDILKKKDTDFIKKYYKKDNDSYYMSKVLQVFLHPEFNGD